MPSNTKQSREVDYLGAQLFIEQKRQERERLSLMLQARQTLAMERMADAMERLLARIADKLPEPRSVPPPEQIAATEPELCPIHELPMDDLMTCEQCRAELEPQVAQFSRRR